MFTELAYHHLDIFENFLELKYKVKKKSGHGDEKNDVMGAVAGEDIKGRGGSYLR